MPRRPIRPRTPGKSGTLTGITPREVLEPLLSLLDAVGVSRREVAAIVRSVPRVKLAVPATVVRGQLEYWSRPLVRWAADTRFVGPDGRPRDLPFAAGDPNFAALVAIDLPAERPAHCRDTLLAIGSIVQLPNGRLRWRERTALAYGADSGVILADEYLQPLRSLLLVLRSNLLDPEASFQRAVSGFEIPAGDLAELNSLVARHGTAFLESVDDWLAHHQVDAKRAGRSRTGTIRPYVGLYLSCGTDAARPPRKRRRRKPRG